MPALKSWSASQLSLLILAGILSVWVMGAIAYGWVSDFDLGEDSSARSVPTASRSVDLEDEPERPSPAAPPVAPSPATQAIVGSSSFSVECSQPRAVPRQSSESFGCQVVSRGGFSQAVAISCANLPRALNCEPQPSIVTPPANGIVAFRILLTNYDVPPGRHQFKVVASLPGASAVFDFPFDSSGERFAASPSPAPGRVDIQCETGSTRLIPGQSITYQCTYSSQLFYGNVLTSCSGTPGIRCEIAPPIVAPRDGQPAVARLSLSVAPNLSSAGSNQVIGVYGEPSGTAPPSTHKFTVDVPPPDYALSCAQKTLDAPPGQPASIQCRVSSASGYVGPLHLKLLTIDPNGANGSVAPPAVQVGPGGTAEVTLSFTSGPTTAPGTYRYALGVHADETEAFTATTGDTPHNVVLAVTVPEPAPSPSPSPTGSG